MASEIEALSERELEVLTLVATGATNQQIARALVISPNTVKVHLRNIFDKLQVQSRTEATMEAVRRGWVDVPGATLLADGAAAPVEEPLVNPAAWRRARPLRWQRVFMLVAFVAVTLATVAPSWLRARELAAPSTPLSDIGRPAPGPAVRADAARWSASAQLPLGRSRLAAAVAGGKLYAIGGETAQGITGRVDVYDPRSNGWLPGTDKPTPVANVQAATIGDLILVPGGTGVGGGPSDALEVLDTRTGTWSTAAPVPVPLAGYALAAHEGRLYLFGGWDGTAYRAETWVYDPKADAWTPGAPMAAPRAFHSAAALGDEVIVAGGYDGRQELDGVAAYDPEGQGAWRPLSALGQARGGLGLVAVGQRLYAVGGGWSSALAFNEQYDAQTRAWSRIGSPIPGEWRNLSVVALDQRVYAVGGWSGGYLAANETYLALIRQLLPLSSKRG